MRVLIAFVILMFGSASFAAKTPTKREYEVVQIEDLSHNPIVVDGIKMVSRTITRAEAIMWDEDGTTYFVRGTYLGETSAMRISGKGVAKQDKTWFRDWPLLVDHLGDVYAIDDSIRQDLTAKLQYWRTPAGLIKAAGYGIAGGSLITFLGAVDHATFSLFFDPHTTNLGRFLVTGAFSGMLRAFWDTAKSHRQLDRGFNFFTRRIARNVDRLETIRYEDGLVDLKIHYKNGDSRGQPQFMSDVFAESKTLEYRNANCMKFLEK